MPPTFRDDPYGAYNFQVIVDGVSDDGASGRAAFTEVSGLEVEIEVIEYRAGNEDTTARKMPGLRKYSNLVLKRGMVGDAVFWDWLREAMDGSVRRADGAIVLLDESREEVMRWRFRRAWPCRWTGPTLSAGNSEVALETLELCHEGIELDK